MNVRRERKEIVVSTKVAKSTAFKANFPIFATIVLPREIGVDFQKK
tara:strand:- start:1019 stop:1156 length:138 start_codon:yes stop_codon:yes gene_type:complete